MLTPAGQIHHCVLAANQGVFTISEGEDTATGIVGLTACFRIDDNVCFRVNIDCSNLG